jgi:hypothetical protein
MTDDKIKLGVLWKNLSREGNKPYLSGRVDRDNLDAAVQLLRAGGRFLILTNKKRPDKQDPDCEIFVVPEPGRREERSGAAPHNQRRAVQGGEQNKQRAGMGSQRR